MSFTNLKATFDIVINKGGADVLQNADTFCEGLRQEGTNEVDIRTVGLLLGACPSVLTTVRDAANGSVNLTNAEAESLVNAAVQETNLNTSTVRRILSDLFHAAGVSFPDEIPETAFSFRAGNGAPKALLKPLTMGVPDPEFAATLQPVPKEYANVLETEDEDASEYELDTDDVDALAILAANGDAKACYLMGLHLYDEKTDSSRDKARIYFERAAELGYGPAYGALADYEISGKRQNMRKAAVYLRHPGSLSQPDGSRWRDNAAKVFAFWDTNKRRFMPTLILALVFLVLSLYCFTASMVFGLIATIVSAACIVMTVLIRFRFQYVSYSWIYLGFTVSWLLMILAIF